MNQERAWSLRQNPTTDDCEQQNEDGEDREISELEHYQPARIPPTVPAGESLPLPARERLAGGACKLVSGANI
jgi:hypothetical protein